jgi:ribosome-associated toxin RatA of RatAB toxin-antitoxin module
MMVATLAIAKGPFREKFTTRNTLTRHRQIHLSLIDGPFRLLEGDWHFMPEAPGTGSQVSLDLHFEFGSGLAARLISPVFETIAGRFVEAFCARAHSLYSGSLA